MVWAGISAEGKTDLLILRGGVTAHVYVDQVLRPLVVPYAAAVDDGFFLHVLINTNSDFKSKLLE